MTVQQRRHPRAGGKGLIVSTVMALGLMGAACAPQSGQGAAAEDPEYPWHTDITATTFWVGEIHDPDAVDGSQVQSAYDSFWLESYGGCDGQLVEGVCQTEERFEADSWLPGNMTPKENPFYLDLPFDDVNNPRAFAMRGDVIPWAGKPGYAGRETDKSFSYMKNRWVRITKGDRECYGQIQDAGPSIYDDDAYVFGTDDARPANTRFNGAGMDVSPALNGCLGFSSLNGATDRVNWQFVDDEDVPDGPWLEIVTTRQVQHG